MGIYGNTMIFCVLKLLLQKLTFKHSKEMLWLVSLHHPHLNRLAAELIVQSDSVDSRRSSFILTALSALE